MILIRIHSERASFVVAIKYALVIQQFPCCFPFIVDRVCCASLFFQASKPLSGIALIEQVRSERSNDVAGRV
jgi:hypothetical protein